MMKDIFIDYWTHKKFRIEASNHVSKKVLTFYPIDKKTLVGSMVHEFWFNEIKNSSSVLDFGAGDLLFKEFVLNKGFEWVYKTLDVNTIFDYDYHNIDEIKETFDCICAFEVIEHISAEECKELLYKFYNLLNKNGKLILTTPNIHHINHFWKTDYTHIRPYPYEDLYALLKEVNFSEITIYRIEQKKRNSRIYDKFKYIIKRILFHFLEVDYTTNICAIAQKL